MDSRDASASKNYDSFYHPCQIKEMIGEADKDDSGSVDFGERNVFHLALLLVCLFVRGITSTLLQ